MEVVHGPGEWCREVDCKECKSTLKVFPGDVRVGNFGTTYYAGDSGEEKYYAECCVCGSTLFLKDVPPTVKKMADKVRGK